MLLLASYYGRKDCLTVFIMLPPRQTGRRGHNVLSVSVRSSVRSFHRSFFWYQTREHDNLNTNEPVLMPFVTNGPRGKCVNRVHFTRAAAEASYGRSQSSSLVCFMHFMISVGCPMSYFVSFTGNSVLFFNTISEILQNSTSVYKRTCQVGWVMGARGPWNPNNLGKAPAPPLYALAVAPKPRFGPQYFCLWPPLWTEYKYWIVCYLHRVIFCTTATHEYSFVCKQCDAVEIKTNLTQPSYSDFFSIFAATVYNIYACNICIVASCCDFSRHCTVDCLVVGVHDVAVACCCNGCRNQLQLHRVFTAWVCNKAANYNRPAAVTWVSLIVFAWACCN